MLTFIIKKHWFFEHICVFKVNDSQRFRHRPLTNKDFGSKNIKIRCNFPQMLEMRITFASCRKFMTYKHYIN